MQLPTRIPLLPLTLALAASTSAQTPPPASPGTEDISLETLRVTADLWESPLDRIPASVSVYDDLTRQAGEIRHFGDLADQIPNLTWTGGTSRPRYLQIRGIGENSQYEGETPDSAVRFLIDDFDLTGLGTVGSTFDVEQVEVLRGPQAGAFGANAAGGVVRLVSRAPTPFWTGRIEGSMGEDDLRSGGFAIGGPLAAARPDTLMMRLAVHQHRSDNFRRNLALNADTNARDELFGRLRLTWNPSDSWTWHAGVLWADADNGFDDFALDNNGRYTYSDQPGRDAQETFATSLRGSFDGWQDVRFTTVSSAIWTDSIYSYDDDWTTASYEGFSDLRRDRKVLNQELRLDSVGRASSSPGLQRWTTGAFFSRIDESSTYTNEDPGNVRGLATDYESTNLALFGQVAYALAPRTRVIVGLRGEHLDVEGTGLRTRFRKASGTFDPEGRLAPRFDDTLFGGKLTLEHDLSERHLVFASVTRGYKGGGINVDARIDPATDPLTYDTEYLWNYEIGVRGHWLEERVRGELTAFYLDRHDTQVRDSAGFGGSYRFFTDNGEGAEVYGLEAAGSLSLSRDWRLHGSLALMGSELEPFVLENGNAGGGRRLANTPRYGYTVGVSYRPTTGWFGAVEVVGRASHYDSNNQDEKRSAFDVVNASLGYTWGSWTATLWARNLFDERYENRVFFFGNEDPDYIPQRYESVADPRQAGVSLAYTF